MDNSIVVPFGNKNGFLVNVEVGVADPEETVSMLSAKINEVLGPLGEFVDEVKSELMSASPDRVAVEFGFDFTLEDGGIVGLIMKGSAKSNLKITLEWSN